MSGREPTERFELDSEPHDPVGSDELPGDDVEDVTPPQSRLRSLIDAVSYGVVGKALGFLIPIIVAAAFGVSRDTDSFFLALVIAAAVIGVWGMSLEQFTVPLLSEVRGKEATSARIRWLQSRILIGVTVTWVLAGLGLLTYLVLWSAPEFRDATMLMFLFLTPQVILSGAGVPYVAYLVARGEYRWPSGSAGIRAVGVLALVLLAPRAAGLAAVAIGYSVGEAMRVVMLRSVARSRIEKERGTRPAARPAPGTVRRARAQMSSMGLASVGPVAERSVAAALGVGAVTQLEYGMKLFYVPSVVFDTNVMSVFLSEWSRLVAARRWVELRSDVRRATLRVFAIAAAVAIMVILLREPIVQLVLARGAFPPEQVVPVARILGILMLAMPFATSAMLASAAYIAMGENRLLLNISVLKTVVRVGGLVLLAPWIGLPGIAVAFVLMHVIEWIVSYILIMRVTRSRESGQGV